MEHGWGNGEVIMLLSLLKREEPLCLGRRSKNMMANVMDPQVISK